MVATLYSDEWKNVITQISLGRDPGTGLFSKGRTAAVARNSELKRSIRYLPNARVILVSSIF
jgi:hypothetical protein